MTFSPDFFSKIDFTPKQINQYLDNAKKHLRTAGESENPDVILHFCYMAVIKLGIALIAKKGYKIRSIPGHHFKILEKFSEITGMKTEINYLQRIRHKRNIDLYEGGMILTRKESSELLKITKKIFAEYNN